MTEALSCWCCTSAVVRSSSERVTHQQDIKEGRGMEKNRSNPGEAVLWMESRSTRPPAPGNACPPKASDCDLI